MVAHAVAQSAQPSDPAAKEGGRPPPRHADGRIQGRMGRPGCLQSLARLFSAARMQQWTIATRCMPVQLYGVWRGAAGRRANLELNLSRPASDSFQIFIYCLSGPGVIHQTGIACHRVGGTDRMFARPHSFVRVPFAIWCPRTMPTTSTSRILLGNKIVLEY
eukprot:SAG31_NODE_79_length_27235_cov_6.268868_5_plen_162_part_00